MELFQKEKNDLEKQISEKVDILENKEIEIAKIRKRKRIIKSYENAMNKCKSSKKRIIWYAFLSILACIVIICEMVLIDGVSFYLPLVVGVTIGSGGYYVSDYLYYKKIIKKITQNKYEKLKANEEKDKELKLSLEEECRIIIQEIIDLKEILAWFAKEEDMQKLGYQVKLVEEPQYQNVEEQQKKAMYEQLWNEYLEKKIDYSQFYFDRSKIDCDQKLVKKL